MRRAAARLRKRRRVSVMVACGSSMRERRARGGQGRQSGRMPLRSRSPSSPIQHMLPGRVPRRVGASGQADRRARPVAKTESGKGREAWFDAFVDWDDVVGFYEAATSVFRPTRSSAQCVSSSLRELRPGPCGRGFFVGGAGVQACARCSLTSRSSPPQIGHRPDLRHPSKGSPAAFAQQPRVIGLRGGGVGRTSSATRAKPAFVMPCSPSPEHDDVSDDRKRYAQDRYRGPHIPLEEGRCGERDDREENGGVARFRRSDAGDQHEI